jgi:hypothetical protein
MKITKRQLRRIIKEEKTKLIAEAKVRRLVRRTLRENAPGQEVGVRLYDDGMRSEIVAIDASGNEVGPKIEGWSKVNMTSPETIAKWKEIVSRYGNMVIADDPQELAAVGEPLAMWMENVLYELLGQGREDRQTQPELYDPSAYFRAIGFQP